MRKFQNNRFIKIFALIIIGNCAVLNGSAQSYIEYVDSADYYIKREMWNDAERMTVNALKKSPANKLNYLLWTNLGEIRMRQDRPEDAIQALEIGLAGAPQNTTLLNKMASALLQIGKDSLAMEELDKSLHIDSIQRWPLRMRGMLYLAKKEYEKANTDFERLMKFFPLDEASYKGLGQIQAIKGNSKEALELYSKALSIKGDEETWFYKITIEIESGNLNEAEEDLRYAMKRFPRCGNLFLLRGLIHKIKFQNEAAGIDRKIALEYGSDPLLVEKILPSEKK